MRKMYAVILILASCKAWAIDPIRIEIGTDYKKYSNDELRRRVYDLERAVGQLQDQVFQLAMRNGGGGGNDNGGGGNGGGGGSSIPSGYRVLQDVVTVAYPGSWHMVARSQYTVPQSRYVFANSANNADLEVYSFPGYTNAGQALVAINQWVSKFGYSLKYQTTGQAKGYTVFSGQTLGSGGGLNWVAAFKATGNGVVGIATGANINTGTTHQQTVMKILNSLQ